MCRRRRRLKPRSPPHPLRSQPLPIRTPTLLPRRRPHRNTPTYAQPAPVYVQPEPAYIPASTLYVIPYSSSSYYYPSYSPYWGRYYGYCGPSFGSVTDIAAAGITAGITEDIVADITAGIPVAGITVTTGITDRAVLCRQTCLRLSGENCSPSQRTDPLAAGQESSPACREFGDFPSPQSKPRRRPLSQNRGSNGQSMCCG